MTRIAKVVSGGLLLLGLLLGTESLRWPGTSFPGFLVLPNRVVPSVGLPGWSGIAEGRPVYQQVVLAVDDHPVHDADAVYTHAANHAPGHPVRYQLARQGAVETRTFPLQMLDWQAFVLIFGAYLVSWLAYAALAFVACERWHESPLFPALTVFSWLVGTFALTGVDLYGPARAFRLHAFAEAMLPAAAVHLALVCPRDRIKGRSGVLPTLYGCGAALALAYELFLYDPAAYTAIHDTCQALLGLALLAFTISLGLALDVRDAVLDAAELRSCLLGAVIGFGVPAVVLAISGFAGGQVPVNAIGWFSFVFPIACVTALRPRHAAALLPVRAPA